MELTMQMGNFLAARRKQEEGQQSLNNKKRKKEKEEGQQCPSGAAAGAVPFWSYSIYRSGSSRCIVNRKFKNYILPPSRNK